MKEINCCAWVPKNNAEYKKYHDEEWGVPVHDDNKLFEMLILEGAQAGLSWEIVLKKREGYKKAFKNFDIDTVANMTDDELELLMQNPEIIRNRLKIYSARKNAIVFLKIQKEFGSFDNYIWNFVNNVPIINGWNLISQIPTKTDISDKISKDLKKRGMSFVGTTIIYSYMQAVGIVNDHTRDCWRFEQLVEVNSSY
jgi:DNA-3-methyladenine glycosylase I